MSYRALKILLVHNRYQQRGGEDAVFESELRLLQERGYDAQALVFDNAEIPPKPSLRQSMALGAQTVWSQAGYRRVESAVEAFRPEVVHFHNTFHLISPSGYYAARRSGARVVQTLHNFRLLCANALLYRDGLPCEECVGRRLALPALRHACFRGSRSATAALVTMQALHRAVGTWTRQVDAFIALSEFARERYSRGGLPPEKLFIKPNFLERDPGVGDGKSGDTLFVGRLTPEKGVRTLLAAWAGMPGDARLTIIGDGPLAQEVREFASIRAGVEWLGWRSPAEVLERMKGAAALVLSSNWYEGLPRTLVEAYAVGLPVVASDLGSLAELVEEGVSGLKVKSGDPVVLATALRRLAADPELLRRLRIGARRTYEARYTADQHLSSLMAIYAPTVAEGAATRRKKPGEQHSL